MTQNKVQQASDKAHFLDEETQAVFASVKNNFNKTFIWFVVSWTSLLVIGVYGIYDQIHIFTQSKQHIDCIIKDLSTPQKPGTTHKYIDPRSSLTRDCNIKFTK